MRKREKIAYIAGVAIATVLFIVNTKPKLTIADVSVASDTAVVADTVPIFRVSAYDSIFRVYADTIGWDWKMIAAVAYVESKFDTSAVSSVGARGLMQIMPIVGRQFNISKEEIADPETNIRLAGKLLRQIEKTLKIHPSTPVNDRLSIILACYNGGIGHVCDARRLAKSNGEDYNSWEVVARYLKQKADPAVYESELVRHGKFTGSRQTEAYVREVMKRYDVYRRMVTDKQI